MRKAVKALGLHPNTLRKYADEGKIDSIRNSAGQRLFNVESYTQKNKKTQLTLCYCRVSSAKQKDDLARQVAFMQKQFPNAEIIQDVGSGLNFKREGLRILLERLLCGNQLTIIVSHRDRLCRFGFDLIEYLVHKNGGTIVVLNKMEHSPQQELTSDLLAILRVFSYRMHGLRTYRHQIKQDQNLSGHSTANTL
jgi:predicted site-specific integrase-resolvase